ncbi:uncharacterized protein LOC110035356 [Phalaenopsis equestris]|uniref:uncharacterized protein LOC110035356 n=1 Tax=Phalaenopsis equestris TaxID=78828 RepID=UPI0009E2D8AA|nr:uncharacterized protein LOC110035356 [Phalaenopsis equestris]
MGVSHVYFKSSAIVFIPKEYFNRKWESFRPISLTIVISKIISKIIVCRLQQILDELISPQQTTFISGRRIYDSILISQELIQDLDIKCRGGNGMHKLDISEADDTIKWEFILTVLNARGFTNDFCTLVSNFLENNFYSLIINRDMHGYFKVGRGIE